MVTNQLVSVIIPIYNAEKYISDTIRSVKNQTHPNWEIILVDDCSSDATLSVVSQYESEQIRIYKQEVNQGVAQARNRGVQEAKGRYIAFLDADDLWVSDKLEKQLKLMKEKEAEFTFTSYEFANEDAVGNGKIAHVPEVIDYKKALKNTIIFTSTVMFDLENITKEEIKMPQIKSEDTATWWRVLRNGRIGYGLDEVCTIYRRPAKSLSSNKLSAVKRIWNLYRKAEGLSLLKSAYYFVFYAVNTTVRRL